MTSIGPLTRTLMAGGGQRRLDRVEEREYNLGRRKRILHRTSVPHGRAKAPGLPARPFFRAASTRHIGSFPFIAFDICVLHLSGSFEASASFAIANSLLA